MLREQVREKSPFENGDGATKTLQPETARAEQRVAASMLDLEKQLAYLDGVDLQQLRVTRKDGHWLLMIKGNRNGTKLIAFIAGQRWPDVLETLATSADSRYLNWREDIPPWER